MIIPFGPKARYGRAAAAGAAAMAAAAAAAAAAAVAAAAAAAAAADPLIPVDGHVGEVQVLDRQEYQ